MALVISDSWAPVGNTSSERRRTAWRTMATPFLSAALASTALISMPAAVVEPVAPAEPEPVKATVEPVSPQQPNGDDWLAASFTDYDHLLAAGSAGTPLAELFEQPVGEAAPGPAVLPAHPAAVEDVGWVTQSDEEIAPITEYCFTGAAALRQAMALKEKLQIGVPADHQELLEEIFDLVELGLRQSS